MDKKLANLSHQLSLLSAIHRVSELTTADISDNKELASVLSKIWPAIPDVKHYDIKKVRIEAAPKGLSELLNDASNIANKLSLSLKAVQLNHGILSGQSEPKKTSEDSYKKVMERLAAHPSFIVPEKRVPYRPAKRLSISGESFSDTLLNDRR